MSHWARFGGFAVLAIVVAAVYGAVQAVVPFVGRFSVLFAILIGVLSSALTVGAVSETEHDGRGARIGIALVSASWIYYWCWYFWAGLVLWQLGTEFSWGTLMSPAVLFDVVRQFNELGVWTIGFYSVTPVAGGALTAVWITEALCVYGAAVVTALTHTGDPDPD
jgi:hypothetical protein